jgi:hypothetical protein
LTSAKTLRGTSTRPAPALLFLLACSCGLLQPVHPTQAKQTLRLITRAADIHSLSVAEANRHYPVRLTAVVTYYDPQGPDLFVQDHSGGIWLNVETTPLNVPVSAGDLVEVTGVTEQPDFAPQVGKPHLTVLGRAALPTPKRVSYHAMASTMDDSVRVEVEGIVHRTWKDGNVLNMDVAIDGGHILGRIPNYPAAVPGTLVSAKVRLRGPCGADFNVNNQLVGIYVHVPNLAGLEILEPALADPFDTPVRPINDILRFNPKSTLEQRVQVRGIVAMFRPGSAIFIQDQTTSLYVRTAQTVPGLEPGDQVDIVGFPVVGPYTPGIARCHLPPHRQSLRSCAHSTDTH